MPAVYGMVEKSWVKRRGKTRELSWQDGLASLGIFSALREALDRGILRPVRGSPIPECDLGEPLMTNSPVVARRIACGYLR